MMTISDNPEYKTLIDCAGAHIRDRGSFNISVNVGNGFPSTILSAQHISYM
jgi:hypothetical protein